MSYANVLNQINEATELSQIQAILTGIVSRGRAATRRSELEIAACLAWAYNRARACKKIDGFCTVLASLQTGKDARANVVARHAMTFYNIGGVYYSKTLKSFSIKDFTAFLSSLEHETKRNEDIFTWARDQKTEARPVSEAEARKLIGQLATKLIKAGHQAAFETLINDMIAVADNA